MTTFKKLFASLLMMGILIPAFAFAQTTSTTSASALISQLQSLQQQQQQTVASLVSLLRQGSSGDQVTILQALLAADTSIYPEGTISGFFGKLTAKAVKRFQKKNGLEQVGNVGPKTLKKLQEFLNEHPLAFGTASSTVSSFTTASITARGSGGNKGEDRRPCAIVPPGHLIAPGWLKKHEDEDRQVVPECQTLPTGIKNHGEDGNEQGERKDDHGNRGTTPPPVSSTTAPIISGISVSQIASTTATVAWATNENATGKVYYTTTSPVNLGSALTVGTTTLSMSHFFDLIGLASSTTYFYVLESKDVDNNTSTTSTRSFATTN